MKAKDKVPEFKDRWRIRGTLTTLGPLHVGDGNVLEYTERKGPVTDPQKQSDASTVCVDHRGKPCIPGSAIKGALRARVKAAGAWNDTWAKLLGADDAKQADAEGGKVEFADAFVPETFAAPSFPPRQGDRAWNRDPELEQSAAPPFWSPDRLTGVAVSVSLDRRTRTAKEHFLYHIEYVPAGVPFEFELTGDNLEEAEVAMLWALLDTFNHHDTDNPQPVTLGAQASNSWGKMQWQLTELANFTADDLNNWLKDPTRPNGYEMCRAVNAETLQRIEKLKPSPATSPQLLTIELTLHFPGPLLVRDPQQKNRSEKAKNNGVSQNEKPPDGTPILDTCGYPCIPEKAIRGVLRTRAEMILRTLGHNIPEPSNAPQVRSLQDAQKSGLISTIFGASGWRAPFQASAFTWANEAAPRWLRQEFVAIDRFTGGAADTKKFNANAVVGARLKGTLTLDLARLGKLSDARDGENNSALGLIALVLRDLAEGDLCFGSGSAKGYGNCTVESAAITLRASSPSDGGTRSVASEPPKTLEEWFKSKSVEKSLDALRHLQPATSSTPQPETAHAAQ